MAQEVSRVPNPVAVEGHTNSRPFLQSGYSNWELSADWANAARRVLQNSGVSRIAEVRRLADMRLREPEHPCSERNRRVSLVVRHLLPKQKE